MHLAEGTLIIPAVVSGSALAAAGCAWALRDLEAEAVVRIGLLAAAFFAMSFIHVPLAGTSVHLVGCALLGVLLGHRVWLAVVCALGLQVVLLGYGGLTTLGTTATALALPAMAAGWLIRRTAHWHPTRHGLVTAVAAYGAIQGALLVVALALWWSQATIIGWWFILAHQPVALVEAVITVAVVAYLRRARPDMVRSPCAPVSQPSLSRPLASAP